jgi:hypothetical protein
VDTGVLTNIYLDPKDRERLDFPRLFSMMAVYQRECWMPTYSEFVEWWHGRSVAGDEGSEGVPVSPEGWE